jgi:hypothetical protein
METLLEKPHAKESRDNQHPVYLVFEPDPLVADDLVAALQGLGTADVRQVHDAAALAKAVAALPSLAVAIIGLDQDTVMASSAGALLDQSGALVVLTRGEALAPPHNARWRLLHRPFSEATLLAALRD